MTRHYMQIDMESEDKPDGEGLIRIIKQVLTVFTADWAVLWDVDLIGEARQSLLTGQDEIRVMPLSDLLRLLKKANDIDWASVFLLESKEAAETIACPDKIASTLRDSTASALEKSKCLVRVVDGTYYYVYGPIERMNNIYKTLGGDKKEGLAEELVYPY